MNTIYILGGPPRTAKSTIMTAVAKQKDTTLIPGDAVEHGMRNLLTGNPHQLLRNISFNGSAEWKTSMLEGGQKKPFSNQGSDNELTLQAITGMFDYYRRNNQSIAFEGSMFTPEWVSHLHIEGYEICAAFTGYTDPKHADAIITHAKANPSDWINEWLERDNGDETHVREWVAQQAHASIGLKASADARGYPFFDISTSPFDEYVSAAQAFFLTN